VQHPSLITDNQQQQQPTAVAVAAAAAAHAAHKQDAVTVGENQQIQLHVAQCWDFTCLHQHNSSALTAAQHIPITTLTHCVATCGSRPVKPNHSCSSCKAIQLFVHVMDRCRSIFILVSGALEHCLTVCHAAAAPVTGRWARADDKRHVQRFKARLNMIANCDKNEAMPCWIRRQQQLARAVIIGCLCDGLVPAHTALTGECFKSLLYTFTY